MVFGKKSATTSVNSDMMKKELRYQALVNAYHSVVFRYAYWLCHDKHIAEDLCQETFLRAWKSLDSLLDEQAAKSWLLTIVRRENARRFERKQMELVDVDDVAISGPADWEFEGSMEQQMVRKHIFKLPMEYQEPLLLQIVAGCSGDEIAELLNLNSNTVMTRLFRARNQLKALLTPTTLQQEAN